MFWSSSKIIIFSFIFLSQFQVGMLIWPHSASCSQLACPLSQQLLNKNWGLFCGLRCFKASYQVRWAFRAEFMTANIFQRLFTVRAHSLAACPSQLDTMAMQPKVPWATLYVTCKVLQRHQSHQGASWWSCSFSYDDMTFQAAVRLDGL